MKPCPNGAVNMEAVGNEIDENSDYFGDVQRIRTWCVY